MLDFECSKCGWRIGYSGIPGADYGWKFCPGCGKENGLVKPVEPVKPILQTAGPLFSGWPEHLIADVYVMAKDWIKNNGEYWKGAPLLLGYELLRDQAKKAFDECVK